MKGKDWRIEFAEKPLKFGIFDNLIYDGKDSGHSFLRLVDPEDKIRGELHGFSYDANENTTADFSFNPIRKLKHIFKRSADPFNPHMLKVYHFDHKRTLHPDIKTQTLTHGSHDEIVGKWVKGLERAMEINADDHEYRAINIGNIWTAQNCHLITADLIRTMGLQVPLVTSYAVPGIARTLVDDDKVNDGEPNSYAEYFKELHKALGEWSAALLEKTNPDKVMHEAPEDIDPLIAPE